MNRGALVAVVGGFLQGKRERLEEAQAQRERDRQFGLQQSQLQATINYQEGMLGNAADQLKVAREELAVTKETSAAQLKENARQFNETMTFNQARQTWQEQLDQAEIWLKENGQLLDAAGIALAADRLGLDERGMTAEFSLRVLEAQQKENITNFNTGVIDANQRWTTEANLVGQITLQKLNAQHDLAMQQGHDQTAGEIQMKIALTQGLFGLMGAMADDKRISDQTRLTAQTSLIAVAAQIEGPFNPYGVSESLRKSAEAIGAESPEFMQEYAPMFDEARGLTDDIGRGMGVNLGFRESKFLQSVGQGTDEQDILGRAFMALYNRGQQGDEYAKKAAAEYWDVVKYWTTPEVEGGEGITDPIALRRRKAGYLAGLLGSQYGEAGLLADITAGRYQPPEPTPIVAPPSGLAQQSAGVFEQQGYRGPAPSLAPQEGGYLPGLPTQEYRLPAAPTYAPLQTIGPQAQGVVTTFGEPSAPSRIETDYLSPVRERIEKNRAGSFGSPGLQGRRLKPK